MAGFSVVVSDPSLTRDYVGQVDSGDEWGARLAVTRAAHERDPDGDAAVAAGDSQAPLAKAAAWSWVWREVPDGAGELGEVRRVA